MLSAYLLVSHGSRDPRPAIAMQEIAKMVSGKLASNCQNSEKLVGAGFLELQPEPLSMQICGFTHQILQDGEQGARSREQEALLNLKILPLFLIPGVHVMEDIPQEVELARKILGEKIKIDLLPYLGTHPDLGKLFTPPETQGDARILISHGSRRPGFNQGVEILASQLNAIACYWAVQPNLETTVQQLVTAGKQDIRIIPYFLFAGGITDAIASHVETLKLQFPGISLHLAAPLGATEDLANLIGDLLQQ